MSKEQIIKLANHLRKLADKLKQDSEAWGSWVEGILEGIAEVLELQAEEEPKIK